MSTLDTCEVCGFSRDGITAEEIPNRLRAAVTSFVNVVTESGPTALVRPSPQRWSNVEYGAHVRDVLISIRERMITASIVERPVGAPLYRDERVTLGLYRLDTTSDVANDLETVGQLFVRTFRALPPDYESRELVYSSVTPETVTIRWLGAQALHECEHHLADVRENRSLLGARPSPSS